MNHDAGSFLLSNQHDIMIVIDRVIIDEALFESAFRCDLQKCKGACCVVGELGAPVNTEEVGMIESILDHVKPTLPDRNQRAIEQNGIYESKHGDLFLTTVNGKECVFASFDQDGVATCHLEKLFLLGKTNFQKPISCHLFPIRVKRRLGMDELVYMQIDECEAGRSCGAKERVRLSDFVSGALQRKYGKKWFNAFRSYQQVLENRTRLKANNATLQ